MADIEGKRKPLPGKIQPVSVETPPDTWAHLHEYFGSEGLPLPIGKQVSRLQKRLESKPRPITSSSVVSSTTSETRATVTTSVAQSSTFQPPNTTPSLSPPETTKRSAPTEVSQPTGKQEPMAKNDLPRIRASSRLAQQFETTGKQLFYGPTEPSLEESQESLLNQMPYRIPTGKENVIPPRTPMSTHRVKSQMPFLTTKAQARPPSFGWGQPRRDAGDDDEADEQSAVANGDPAHSGSESSPEGPGSGPKAPSTQSTPSPLGSASNSQSPELTIQDLRVDDHVPASRPYRSRLDSMRDYDESASLSKKPRHERYDSGKSTIDHVESPRAQTPAPAPKSEAKPNGSANIPASSHSYQTSHEKSHSRLTTNTAGTPIPAAIVPGASMTPTVPSTSTAGDHPKLPQPNPASQPKQSRPQHSEGIAAIAQSLAVGVSKTRPTKESVGGSGTAASPVVISAQENPTPAPQTQPSVDLFGGRTVMMVNNRPYTRLSQVGKGGSSKVYKVLASNNRIFALKRVSFERADKVTIAGYVNEINLLQKLEKNSRIVRLYDAEINNQKGALSLLMEFGEIDLAHLLLNKREEPFDIHFVGLYWRQMLEAVAAIHDLKIVHSDLKPANFLLVEGSLKLIDFGIANAISNDTTNIHREGQLGTANYMSPEAISSNPASGTRKLGRSSDVWSLGCILYQMVYGKTPFSDIPNVFQKMSVITDSNHVIPFPKTTLSPLQIKTPSTKGDKGRSPPNVGSEGKNMLLPTSVSPSESALPSSPNSNEQPQQFEIMVDPNLIRIMKGCLAREPKDRLSIPQLLNDVFIKPPCLSVM
ncbi:Dual-specificity kinase, spindle pole body (SPB) duplication and spindle checkpoint function [Podila clonocystis]|nr:Dual-specificity kinase, spindle pole body (SPB) duplication and spindle checkpoint function [Podila clonocystis]